VGINRPSSEDPRGAGVDSPGRPSLEPGEVSVHHIANAHTVTWMSILPVIRFSIDESGVAKQPTQVVLYGGWLSKLSRMQAPITPCSYERFLV
jgi:hypothetical protein